MELLYCVYMYGTGTGLRVLFKIDQWAKGKTMKICAHAVGVIDIVLQWALSILYYIRSHASVLTRQFIS